ncbi:MAG TPA: SgcJ/EcaC family oxidoreductase [Gemmataceae bacterium]|nr:SgcJ/EcaC family oxidoreductase [Gemmataceae bacterium]
MAAALLVAAGALAGWFAAGGKMVFPAFADEKAGDGAPPARAEAKDDSADSSAIRKEADEFVKAFNKGDAKAVAAFWTKDGEYVGPDGETLRGREAIEKGYADFFKKNPRASLEVKVESLRLFGRHTAVEEGTLKLRLAADKEAAESRYSVLHVHDDDGWHLAQVREWLPDAAELVSLKDVEWLIGEWRAKRDEAELHVSYAWDEDRAFLRGRYSLKKDGKVVSSGTQVIGKDPAGGLRSWVFDSSGSFGESSWSRDGDRWVIAAGGMLPNGSEVTATNVLIPLGKDAFTWQSIERTAGGVSLPETPPIKVTRVKTEK